MNRWKKELVLRMGNVATTRLREEFSKHWVVELKENRVGDTVSFERADGEEFIAPQALMVDMWMTAWNEAMREVAK